VVDVEALVEVADLGVAGQVRVLEALARGLGAAARERTGLQHGDLVACLAELVGRGQAGQAATEDHDPGLLAAGEWRRRGLRRGEAEAQRIHPGHRQRHAAQRRQLLEEPPACPHPGAKAGKAIVHLKSPRLVAGVSCRGYDLERQSRQTAMAIAFVACARLGRLGQVVL
jgi:hypothetical protein